MKVQFKNRYNDIYTFTKTDEGILWEGSFSWIRREWSNNYDKAYKAYCEDEKLPMSPKEFISQVHQYDADTLEAGKIAKKYASLVYSDTSKINMIDPSGGPYLSVETNMEVISPEFKGLIIDGFKKVDTGYLILLK
jgi:hypothetical protein